MTTREACWSTFKAAVAALQRGDKSAVAEYLRGIEARAGRKVAEDARREVAACAKAWKPRTGDDDGTSDQRSKA